MDFSKLKVVGFDADDTLWVNEQYFREAEESFCELMSRFKSREETMKILFDTEMKTLHLYGYGIKGFMLSMIEAASIIANNHLDSQLTDKIMAIGKAMLEKPVLLLDNVQAILEQLQGKYKLVLVTKGDLLDQERKLEKSGLAHYFHHIEIMSEKKERDYQKLIGHLDILPKNFVMIGNSLRSDILPLVNIHSNAIYVPHEITWQHENIEVSESTQKQYHEVPHLNDILQFL